MSSLMNEFSSNSEVLRLTTSFESINSLSQRTPEYPIARYSTLMSDIKSLEHPTLKVPYELLNKKYRGAQKNIDREVSHLQASVCELEKGVLGQGGNAATVGTITELLSGVVEKLVVLKRKARESINDELDAATCCKKRLDHLKEHCNKSENQTAAEDQWKKKRLDRMLVEHFLRSGYYDTAIKLALHSKIENLTNIDLFLISRQVEESLDRKETVNCLNWCHDNKSKLRKIKSNLEFNLRQQEFIELVRRNQRLEAIKHARKHFVNLEPAQHQDLEHVMGLLAFPPGTDIEPYKSFFEEAKWKSLIDQFRQENFKLFQLSSTSVFSITLQSGLSALKTPQCYKKDGERNPDCPVCSDLLNKLARPLPCAHCSQSRLICSISGDPLNEHNLPLVLPNGNVYGENSLKLMAQDHDGKVICPKTKEVFDLKQAEKVYVM